MIDLRFMTFLVVGVAMMSAATSSMAEDCSDNDCQCEERVCENSCASEYPVTTHTAKDTGDYQKCVKGCKKALAQCVVGKTSKT